MKLISKFLTSIGVGIIGLISLIAILFSLLNERELASHSYGKPISYLKNFEARFYDYRMKSHLSEYPKNDDLVLVKIDDQSLQKIGSYPIPRDNYVTLLDNLKKYGAKVAAFDVLFPEKVMACGEDSPDDRVAQAISRFQSVQGNSVILAYSVQEDPGIPTDYLFDNAPFEVITSIVTTQSLCRDIDREKIESTNWPIQPYLDAEPQLGYLNMESDTDGVYRSYKAYQAVYSQDLEDVIYLPSLGLRTFLSGTDVDTTKLNISSDCTGRLELGEKDLFINHRKQAKIRWIGGEEKFGQIPLWRVLEGKDYIETFKYNKDGELLTQDVPDDHPSVAKIEKVTRSLEDVFKDKIVFIASTATGAHDLRNTPVDSKLPGVYAHMNFTSMLMTGFFYKSYEESIKYSLVLFFLGMLLILGVMKFNNAILDLTTLLLVLGISYYLDGKYFLPKGYELKLFYCYFAFVSTYSWVTFISFYKASAEKKQIKGAFSRYVAPSIVNDMLDNPDKLKVGGEKRDITCMFSDVRDFTSISEQLTATELAMALNRYMGEMTDIVFETNGTLDKYIGDAIVAFWGAPLDIGDHVNQAVDAGVRMLEALPAINKEFEEKNLPEFKIGLGLNSGECSVGNMGSDQIFAYTALGDNMNLGARLESLCKYYGAQILISEYTFKRLDQDRFTTRLIDNVIVKGKTEPVGVYEVLYSYHPFMKDQVSLKKFKEAFDLFLKGNFIEAKTSFDEILTIHPEDKASNRMSETCAHWIENPPKEGEDFRVTTMKTKG